jgi:hypothetical protein
MQLKISKKILILAYIVTFTMACSLVSGIGDRFSETKEKAQSVATQVQEGHDLLGTAQTIATEVGNSELIVTAQALATEVGDSGLLETAQAFATEQGPRLIGTVQSIATQEGPNLVETARALATQEGPRIKATAQAIATKAAQTFGEAPPDIPVIGGDKENFIGSPELVSYITPLPIDQTLEFYIREMPGVGWSALPDDWFESENLAVLNYIKADRLVSITLSTLPFGDQTVVMITIQQQ